METNTVVKLTQIIDRDGRIVLINNDRVRIENNKTTSVKILAINQFVRRICGDDL